MYPNLIKVALRNMWRQKGYAFINIAGLAIGLAVSILILLYVIFEKSYDRFNVNSDNIYRIYTDGRMGDSEFKGPNSSVACSPTYYEEIPEVINFTRFDRSQNVLIRNGDRTYLENNFLWADSGFFEIFSIPLLKGEPSRVLKEPRSMVISESTARKYFGNEDPVGRILEVSSDSVEYTVTGVMQDIPENCHFHGDFVVDYQSHWRIREKEWTSCNTHAYLLVRDGTRQGDLEAKMDAITREHIGPEINQYLGMALDEWEGAGNYFRFRAQPLKEIHLNPDIRDDMQSSGDKKYVYIFTLVALFIVAMACINFMNLSTARSAGRAREVGMRKLAGSGKGKLVGQFLAESFIMVLIAMLFALLATEMFLPAFNKITRLHLSLDYFGNWYTLPGLLVFSLLVGILAGSYPAFLLASFNPISVISGKFSSGIRSGAFRRLLVVLQFGISIFIILCTLVISRQLKYLLNKDLGFDSDQIVVLERFSEVGRNRAEAFKQEIAKIPGVISSATSTMVPGHPQDYNAHLIKGRPMDQTYLLYVNFIDYDFPGTYGLKLVNGKFPSRDLATDGEGIVINEAAVRKFNVEDPLGCVFIKPLSNGKANTHLPVIGVMKDIHIQSLQTEVMPYMMRIRASNSGWIAYLSIRLQTKNYKAVLDGVQKTWNEFTAGQPFRYFFLNDDFEQHYAQEKRTRIVFLIFSVFAILVACLGLLGLTSYATERRAGEIGIRKALGSTSARIVRLLSREILLLIGIATLVAWPAAWYFSRNWLNDFAYRIDLTVMPFLGSLVIALLIAVLATSFQAVRAALRNPADSLRYE